MHEGEGGAERRREPRRHVHLDVDCEVDGTYLFAQIVDVSSLGIFVRMSNPPPIGTAVTLRFAIPSHAVETVGRRADEPIYVRGRVVWSNPEPEDSAGAGIEFRDLAKKTRRQLVALVETVTSERDT